MLVIVEIVVGCLLFVVVEAFKEQLKFWAHGTKFLAHETKYVVHEQLPVAP